jgi:hypothetical protein
MVVAWRGYGRACASKNGLMDRTLCMEWPCCLGALFTSFSMHRRLIVDGTPSRDVVLEC